MWTAAPPEKLAQRYYDATTWIYRWVWGRSFHFAPLRHGETRRAAIRRYEETLAHEIGIDRGSLCLDLGCGIGGPAATIASCTGARIVGINSNLGQLRALRRPKPYGVGADFGSLPFADATFDRAYAFEALCHAVDLAEALGEVHRVLRPGGRLGFSDWSLTDRFEVADESHQTLRRTIEASYGVVRLRSWPEWADALRRAGFTVAKRVDQAEDGGEPWYRALQPRDRTLDSLGRTASARAIEASLLAIAERCGLVPGGTAGVVHQLRAGTAALIEAGSCGIFTPMMFVVAARP